MAPNRNYRPNPFRFSISTINLTLCLFSILGFLLLANANIIETEESSKEINEHEKPLHIIINNKTGKILSGPSRPSHSHMQGNQIDQSSQGSGNSQKIVKHPGISDIDMQLLNAMEKLVGRMDKLDARVKTLESIVYYLTNSKDSIKASPKQDNCPENFVKMDGIRGKCYYVSSLGKSPNNIFDWKTAAGECGRLGGRLAEMLSYSDFHRISHFLTKYTNTRNNVATDFWTGGLNPGLIWLWSESGQQIELDKRFWNDNDNGGNNPGCLKLSYSVRLDTFFYKGAPCSQPQNFLCEVLDNTVSRALANFESELISEAIEEKLQ